MMAACGDTSGLDENFFQSASTIVNGQQLSLTENTGAVLLKNLMNFPRWRIWTGIKRLSSNIHNH
jgi:hypothetical protein